VKWKKQLEDFDSLIRELKENRNAHARLRFGRSVIAASDIAEQFYCERKLEMEFLHGEVETEAKNIGSEAHESLTEDAVKVNRERLRQDIYSDKPMFALEMPLLGKYGDVFLAGKPDSVLFAGGCPLVVFEYKFSRSGAAYPSYHVQAQVYCVLLENMGFDVSKLFYTIVVADPKTKGSRALRQDVLNTVTRRGIGEATHSIDNAKIYCNKFHRDNAEKYLTWALEFWRQYREAQPTSNQNKCARCEYQSQCQNAGI
jgi:CRISPR/Cas system-associated exonuclease Cas4 (RecB family)